MRGDHQSLPCLHRQTAQESQSQCGDTLTGLVPGAKDMRIPELAEALNRAAGDFEIGRLQELRRRLRGLERAPATGLFDARTIHPNYAFHVGGRTELQFNIGEEQRNGRVVVRHGVAFSLETSRSFPAIDPLRPKIARFNDYVRTSPEDLAGFRMWHYDDADVLHSERAVAPLEDELIKPGVFVAIGRWVPESDVVVSEILADFDQLLPLYRYVESERSIASPPTPLVFRAGCPSFVLNTTMSLPARTVDIALRHKAIQRALFGYLSAEVGANNVAIEYSLELGVRVDAAVRTPDGLSFYEVKVAPTLQACIRAA